jgi:hypothetical protein
VGSNAAWLLYVLRGGCCCGGVRAWAVVAGWLLGGLLYYLFAY